MGTQHAPPPPELELELAMELDEATALEDAALDDDCALLLPLAPVPVPVGPVVPAPDPVSGPLGPENSVPPP